MTYTTVSPKYQIVVPKEIRESLGLKPHQRMIVMEKDGIAFLIPDVSLESLKGSLKGKKIDISDLRDHTDRI